MKPANSKFVLLTAILLLALSLRLWGLTKESLWGDEMFSAWASSENIGEILRRNAQDVHPPLYYLGLSGWRLIGGAGDGWLRGYSVLWSLIGIGALYLLGRELAGTRIALLAALLAAVNPLSIYYAQEARNYAMLGGILTGQLVFLWRWLIGRSAAPGDWRNRDFWCYLALCLAASYTHYLAAFYLTAQGLFVLCWFYRRRDFRASALIFAAGAATVALFLPWVWYSFSSRGELHYFETNLDWIEPAPLAEYLLFLVNDLFWGLSWNLSSTTELTRLNLWISLTIPVTLILAGLTLASGMRGWPRSPRANGTSAPVHSFLLAVICLPLLFVALSGAFDLPLYVRPRFSLLLLNPLLLLFALGLTAPRNPLIGGFTGLLVCGLMLAGTITQATTQQKFDWRAVAAAWPRERNPDAMVFFPVYIAGQFGYYQHREFHSAPRGEIEQLLAVKPAAEIWLIRPSWDDFTNRPAAGEYYRWLSGMNSPEIIRLIPGAHIRVIRAGSSTVPPQYAQRFDRWILPIEVPGQSEGFDNPDYFHPLEFYYDKDPFRWAKPECRLVLYDIPVEREIVFALEIMPLHRSPGPRFLEISASRGAQTGSPTSSTLLLQQTELQPGRREFAIRAPAGAGPLRFTFRTNAVNLAATGIANDSRDLGVGFYWIGIGKN